MVNVSSYVSAIKTDGNYENNNGQIDSTNRRIKIEKKKKVMKNLSRQRCTISWRCSAVVDKTVRKTRECGKGVGDGRAKRDWTLEF